MALSKPMPNPGRGDKPDLAPRSLPGLNAGYETPILSQVLATGWRIGNGRGIRGGLIIQIKSSAIAKFSQKLEAPHFASRQSPTPLPRRSSRARRRLQRGPIPTPGTCNQKAERHELSNSSFSLLPARSKSDLTRSRHGQGTPTSLKQRRQRFLERDLGSWGLWGGEGRAAWGLTL